MSKSEKSEIRNTLMLSGDKNINIKELIKRAENTVSQGMGKVRGEMVRDRFP
jgi:hypothetical protein